MIRYHFTASNNTIAELTNQKVLISDPQDMLDLIAEIGAAGCDRIIINSNNLHAGFFDLKTKIAGEILQKFSNYSMMLAIVGDFAGYKSKSLQDFIRESNRGRTIFFVEDLESAIRVLSR